MYVCVCEDPSWYKSHFISCVIFVRNETNLTPASGFLIQFFTISSGYYIQYNYHIYLSIVCLSAYFIENNGKEFGLV